MLIENVSRSSGASFVISRPISRLTKSLELHISLHCTKTVKFLPLKFRNRNDVIKYFDNSKNLDPLQLECMSNTVQLGSFPNKKNSLHNSQTMNFHVLDRTFPVITDSFENKITWETSVYVSRFLHYFIMKFSFWKKSGFNRLKSPVTNN